METTMKRQSLILTAALVASLSWGSSAMSAETNALVPAATKAYRLTPNDLVEVKVYRQPDLDTRARVAENGTVTMPLLGSINIGGKSMEEARVMIRDLLDRDYLVNPQVSLAVVEYAKRLFTVMGEVQRPGTYEMPPDQPVNLLQAIAMAGGFTRLGAPGNVAVQRLERGQKKVYRLDAAAMALNEKIDPFLILPGDTITIGERVF
jgi:protein involved in polysaccharide export with SLBB domain